MRAPSLKSLLKSSVSIHVSNGRTTAHHNLAYSKCVRHHGYCITHCQRRIGLAILISSSQLLPSMETKTSSHQMKGLKSSSRLTCITRLADLRYSPLRDARTMSYKISLMKLSKSYLVSLRALSPILGNLKTLVPSLNIHRRKNEAQTYLKHHHHRSYLSLNFPHTN